MLHLDSPRSKYAFQASGFLDRIKECCRKYVIQDFEERQFTFLEMKLECEQLNEFSQRHFPEKVTQIAFLLKSMLIEIEKLETTNLITETGNCKVCNSELKIIDTLIDDKDVRYITTCINCSAEIDRLLTELEKPTGVMWI